MTSANGEPSNDEGLRPVADNGDTTTGSQGTGTPLELMGVEELTELFIKLAKAPGVYAKKMEQATKTRAAVMHQLRVRHQFTWKMLAALSGNAVSGLQRSYKRYYDE